MLLAQAVLLSRTLTKPIAARRRRTGSVSTASRARRACRLRRRSIGREATGTIGVRVGMGRLVTTIGRGGSGRRRGRNCTGPEGIRGEVEMSWTTARVGWAAARVAYGDDGAQIVMARAWGAGDERPRFVVIPSSELSKVRQVLTEPYRSREGTGHLVSVPLPCAVNLGLHLRQSRKNLRCILAARKGRWWRRNECFKVSTGRRWATVTGRVTLHDSGGKLRDCVRACVPWRSGWILRYVHALIC